MATKNNKRTLIATALLAAVFASGYASAEPDKVSSRAYTQGIEEMRYSVEDCTLGDAHAGRCFIPCSTDTDCEEKNGSGRSGYLSSVPKGNRGAIKRAIPG